MRVDLYRRPEAGGQYSYLVVLAGKPIPEEANNTDWQLAERVPEFHKRVRSWGYGFVRSRQLAYNRREICLAATDRAAK